MTQHLPSGLRVAVFDFDFTLGDSSRAVVACMDRALDSLGLGPVTPDAVKRTIGLTLEVACEQLTGVSDPKVLSEFKTLFVRAADDMMVVQTELLEGAMAALESLQKGGIRLGIVTTKYRFRVEDILDRLEERHRFSIIVGGDDVAAHKPDPQGLVMAVERLGVSPSEALYVGDHVVDAGAAEGAGVPFIGVLTGTTDHQAFQRYPHLGILPGVRDLPAFLGQIESWPPPIG